MCTLPETGRQQMKQADGSGIVLLEHLADFLEQHRIQMVNSPVKTHIKGTLLGL